jgi:hypothetical protein
VLVVFVQNMCSRFLGEMGGFSKFEHREIGYTSAVVRKNSGTGSRKQNLVDMLR